MKGLPLALLPLLAVLPAALQTPGSKPLVSSPGDALLANPSSVTRQELALMTLNTASVVVAPIPDELKADVTQEDVSEWTTNYLRNIGIKVIPRADQTREFSAAGAAAKGKGDEMGTLRAMDQQGSRVFVRLDALRAPGGVTVYKMDVEVLRGTFMHPGYYVGTTVWSTDGLGFFGSGLVTKQKIREAVINLLGALGDDLKKARAARKPASS